MTFRSRFGVTTFPKLGKELDSDYKLKLSLYIIKPLRQNSPPFQGGVAFA